MIAEVPTTTKVDLSEDELYECIEYFSAYRLPIIPQGVDKKDLPVATSSLSFLMRDMGFYLTEAELSGFQTIVDPKNEGHVLLPKFLEEANTLFARSRITTENYDDIFGMFDMDGDGLILQSDLKEMLSIFGEAAIPDYFIKEMLQEADIDTDNAIGMDEFFFFLTGQQR